MLNQIFSPLLLNSIVIVLLCDIITILFNDFRKDLSFKHKQTHRFIFSLKSFTCRAGGCFFLFFLLLLWKSADLCLAIMLRDVSSNDWVMLPVFNGFENCYQSMTLHVMSHLRVQNECLQEGTKRSKQDCVKCLEQNM